MMLKNKGANIVPYSFRNYYSLRGHIACIDYGSMAKSMGNSIEAHHILLKPIIETILILQKQAIPTHLSKLMRGWQHEL